MNYTFQFFFGKGFYLESSSVLEKHATQNKTIRIMLLYFLLDNVYENRNFEFVGRNAFHNGSEDFEISQ